MKSLLTLSLLGYLPMIAFAPADAAGSGAAATKPATPAASTQAKPADAKPADAKADAKPAKDDKPKEPKRGIGTVAMEAIKKGATNQEALAAVRKEFPDAETTMASINWYRNKLRTDGVNGFDGKPVPSAREQAKAEKAKAEAIAKDGKAPASDPTA